MKEEENDEDHTYTSREGNKYRDNYAYFVLAGACVTWLGWCVSWAV
jgi:hypothetical protein